MATLSVLTVILIFLLEVSRAKLIVFEALTGTHRPLPVLGDHPAAEIGIEAYDSYCVNSSGPGSCWVAFRLTVVL